VPFTPVPIFGVACGEVSRVESSNRPLRCARDPRTRTAALHKVPLSLGRNCSSGWHPRGVRPTAGLPSFTRRLPRIPCSLRGLAHGRHVDNHGLEPVRLAAGAGEDRAALSGRPRKANASQYASVMPQRAPTRNRDASTRSLVALAEEDRAALSGRPRKATADQYAGVMHQCHRNNRAPHSGCTGGPRPAPHQT